MTGLATDLPLLQRLHENLSASDIAWRPQETEGVADRRAGGPDDVEFLVREADTGRFTEILRQLGFKEANPLSPGRRPELGHYCGYDWQADRIVRLRARFRPEIGNGANGNGHARARDARDRGPVALVSGGAVIAVVGADGAGKTTALEALRRWLRPHFRVVTLHMGKPPWSWSTFPIKGALKLVSLLDLGRPRWARPGAEALDRSSGVRRLLWQAVTARDRYRAYLRARRLAAHGALVLCDRFPLAEVRSMDGRLDDGVSEASPSWTTRALVELAERYYAGVGRPDLLVVLRVRPDLARRRRPEDPADRVRRRALEILAIDWSAVDARVLDSDRSMNELLRELKSWVWSRL